jgi:hypothetical protein
MADEWVNFGPRCYSCEAHQAEIKRLRAKIATLEEKGKDLEKKETNE